MPEKNTIRLPSASDHMVICGQTGSGKSQAAAWQLSLRDIDVRPWVIIDHKNDPEDLINNIEKSQEIDFDSKLPTAPGIYHLRCNPDDGEFLHNWFLRVKDHRNMGIFIDEAMMLGRHNKGYNTMLTQGRALKVTFINITQRPVMVSPWAFSEAKFWQVFNLIKKRDRETVADDVPISVDYDLPEYFSYYYDVAQRKLNRLKPVPDAETILATFDKRLPKLRKRL